MSIFEAVILGIVQGLSEFLPVSSSGHLVLFQRIFGIDVPGVTFDIFLHVATLISVFIALWADIWALVKRPFQKTSFLIVAATLPIVIVALLFKDTIDSLFSTAKFLGVNFIITGLLLMLADIKMDKTPSKRLKSLDDMTFKDAGFVGVMQAFAVAPAISRSGATICGSLFAGLNREAAAKFSFLMSIPAILGGFVLELKDVAETGGNFFALGVTPMLAGFVAAAASGLFAVNIMLKIIKTKRLKYFSYYVFALGILILLDQNLLHIFF